MLVAYSFFGDCNAELANTGTPSTRAKPIVDLLLAACRRLVSASALFERAASQNRAAALVAAGRLVLTAEPIVDRARARLQALGSS
jgi:hypothetical protein